MSSTVKHSKILLQHKMEGNQLEGRGDNKMWLVRHLEVIRILMLEDLRIAKNHLVPVFPPRYNIAQHCISLYHRWRVQ